MDYNWLCLTELSIGWDWTITIIGLRIWNFKSLISVFKMCDCLCMWPWLSNTAKYRSHLLIMPKDPLSSKRSWMKLFLIYWSETICKLQAPITLTLDQVRKKTQKEIVFICTRCPSQVLQKGAQNRWPYRFTTEPNWKLLKPILPILIISLFEPKVKFDSLIRKHKSYHSIFVNFRASCT